MNDLKIEQVAVEKLLPYANNAKIHDAANIKKIVNSINEFGFNNPVLTDSKKGILAGHGRVLAAKSIGLKTIPTIELSHLSEVQKKAYILADNKLTEDAKWDQSILDLEIKNLVDMDFDIDLTGFDLDDFDLEEKKPGLTDEDAVPEVTENVCKLGDLWLLGEHRLLCGDSTDIEQVGKLMDGQKADMVFTDPPYGIDEKCDRAFESASRKAKGNKFEQIKNDDSIDCAIQTFDLVQGLNIKRQVWWGANYYSHHIPQTGNWFVWDKRVEENQKDLNSDCELAYVKSEFKSVRIFRHLWKGMIKDSEHGEGRVHPTQKPIALAEWAFDYFKKVESVLDLFLGSGSTLIACEKTNRKCYGMELDEHYCDVIIQRYIDYTGDNKIIKNGEKFVWEMND